MKFQDFPTGRFYNEDCFEAMKEIPDGVIDMVLCDLPYGTTQNKWDSVLELERLWKEYWRIVKPNAAIVLTAQTPFDKLLGYSQIQYLRYEWVWRKNVSTGFMNAKKMPLKIHENALVFYRELPIYNPQMSSGKPYKSKRTGKVDTGENYGNVGIKFRTDTVNEGHRYPNSVIDCDREVGLHPTQKPVALFEYIIKTYTNENELILDNTAGSGTTAIAAINTNRKWVCIEKETEYYDKAINRIINHGWK